MVFLETIIVRKKNYCQGKGDSGGNARSMNMYKIGTLVH